MNNEMKKPKDLVYKKSPIELKEDGDKRYLEAVFSLFDTIDSDNDITKAGALKSGYGGNKVPLVWNHEWSKVIGRGVIESDNQKAVFKGYFLDTQAGKEAYETVKQMQRYVTVFIRFSSNGFRYINCIIDSKGDEVPVRVLKDVKVWEVSPVLVGSQQNSFVQALKSGLDSMDSDPNEEDEEVIDDIDTEFEEVKEQKRPLGDDLYTTIEEAEKEELGCSGHHEHMVDGETVYMRM